MCLPVKVSEACMKLLCVYRSKCLRHAWSCCVFYLSRCLRHAWSCYVFVWQGVWGMHEAVVCLPGKVPVTWTYLVSPAYLIVSVDGATQVAGLWLASCSVAVRGIRFAENTPTSWKLTYTHRIGCHGWTWWSCQYVWSGWFFKGFYNSIVPDIYHTECVAPIASE